MNKGQRLSSSSDSEEKQPIQSEDEDSSQHGSSSSVEDTSSSSDLVSTSHMKRSQAFNSSISLEEDQQPPCQTAVQTQPSRSSGTPELGQSQPAVQCTHGPGQSQPAAQCTHGPGQSQPAVQCTHGPGQSQPAVQCTHGPGLSHPAVQCTHGPGQSEPAAQCTHGPGQSQPAVQCTHGPGQSQPAVQCTHGPGQSEPAVQCTYGPGQCEPAVQCTHGLGQSQPAVQCTHGSGQEARTGLFRPQDLWLSFARCLSIRWPPCLSLNRLDRSNRKLAYQKDCSQSQRSFSSDSLDSANQSISVPSTSSEDISVTLVKKEEVGAKTREVKRCPTSRWGASRSSPRLPRDRQASDLLFASMILEREMFLTVELIDRGEEERDLRYQAEWKLSERSRQLAAGVWLSRTLID